MRGEDHDAGRDFMNRLDHADALDEGALTNRARSRGGECAPLVKVTASNRAGVSDWFVRTSNRRVAFRVVQPVRRG